MKTYSAKPAEIERRWHVIDGSGQVLGRLASQVAKLLMGKHKPIFTPNQDTGDYVVVINAAQIKVTGNKARDKLYHRHSGYAGGFKSTSLGKLMETRPTRVMEMAVRGMLPHTRLGRAMFKKLKVYPGPAHPHQGQVRTQSKQGGEAS